MLSDRTQEVGFESGWLHSLDALLDAYQGGATTSWSSSGEVAADE